MRGHCYGVLNAKWLFYYLRLENYFQKFMFIGHTTNATVPLRVVVSINAHYTENTNCNMSEILCIDYDPDSIRYTRNSKIKLIAAYLFIT